MASQITSITIVYSTVYWDADQRKYPVTGEFPAQRASNAENVSIWWRHHSEGLLAAKTKVIYNTFVVCKGSDTGQSLAAIADNSSTVFLVADRLPTGFKTAINLSAIANIPFRNSRKLIGNSSPTDSRPIGNKVQIIWWEWRHSNGGRRVFLNSAPVIFGQIPYENERYRNRYTEEKAYGYRRTSGTRLL